MDRVFHKYRGDSKFTESIVTSGKVYLATAHQLNDPFECSIAEIGKEWIAKQVETGMQASLAGFVLAANQAKTDGRGFFGLEPPEISAAVDAVLSAEDLTRRYEAWHAFMLEHTGHRPSDCRAIFLRLDEQLTETGIFSLSSDPAQPLMWAHYGQDHRGLCFGFRQSPGTKLANPNHCLPVLYSNELPSMDESGFQTEMTAGLDAMGRPYTMGLRLAFEDKTFQRVVSTKSTHWAYEQEVRYVEPFSGLCDWPGELSECTFGLRCRDDRRRHYIELLEAHVPNDVLLFEIRMKPGTNTFERVALEPPIARSRCQLHLKSAESDQITIEEFVGRMGQLLQQQRFGDVIFQVGENLKQNPSSSPLLHLLATAHGLAQEHPIAYRYYKDLADKHPEIAAPWYGMACALIAMGDSEDAIPLLRRAFELDPNDPSIALNLGALLIGAVDTRAEGLTYLRRAEKLGHRRARRIMDDVEGASGRT